MGMPASDFSYPDAASDVAPRFRVAVVDDDVRIGRLLKAFLEGRGIECVPLADAPGLFKLLTTERIDAVVSDIVMPGITGLELLRSVRRIAPQVPVVLITGFPRMEFVREAMKEGAVDFLQKPVDLEELEKALGAAMESAAKAAAAEEKSPRRGELARPLSRQEKQLARRVRKAMRQKEWRGWHWLDRMAVPFRSAAEEVRLHPWFYVLAMGVVLAASMLTLTGMNTVVGTARRPGMMELLERAVTALEEDNRLDRQNPR
ncbi:MAG: response regulator [Nitrospirae bacterium]|nr:response regulator [Nitrospirota bacterium]